MEPLIVDIGHGRQVIRETAFPSNSHKRRDIEEEDIVPIPIDIKDHPGYYYVRIKHTVWPELYGGQIPIPFPTLKAAWGFAENNVAPTRPVTRVYTSDGDLCWMFTYKEKK
jgi:hypothetical protein